MTGAIASFAAIIFILGMYDNRLLSSWPHDVQINTVLSALATLLKGSMLVSVCACLGQLKWTWYADRGQPLQDFQIFDGASRGPLGAAQLLYRLKFCHTASIGSLVVLMTLASDAFIQQSVSYPLRQLPQSTHATVPFAQAYNQVSTILDESSIISPPLMTAIYDGMLSSNLSQSASSIIPRCPTGNCTFPIHTSLAVCSHCANVTSLLRYSYDANIQPDGTTLGADHNYTLPNGLFLSSAESAVGLFNMSSAVDLNLKSDALAPYIGLGHISSTSFIAGPSSAWDCVLSFCAKTYNTSVSRTIFNETPLTILDKPKWTENNPKWSVGPALQPVPAAYNYTFEVPAISSSNAFGQSHIFTVGTIAMAALATQLSVTIGGEGMIGDNGQPYFSTDAAQAFYYLGVNDINRTMANIADALTNAIRVISKEHVQGSSFALETFIHVEWPWLLFPASMLLLALLFFILTLRHSDIGDVPTWRSSALAVMEFGVSRVIVPGEPEREESGLIRGSVEGDTLSDLEAWAGHSIVRLRTKGVDGKRYGLVAS